MTLKTYAFSWPGMVIRQDAKNKKTAVALVQEFLDANGDGWNAYHTGEPDADLLVRIYPEHFAIKDADIDCEGAA